MSPLDEYIAEVKWTLKQSDYNLSNEVIQSIYEIAFENNLSHAPKGEIFTLLGSPDEYIHNFLDFRFKIFRDSRHEKYDRLSDSIVQINNVSVNLERKLRIRSAIGSRFYPKLSFIPVLYLILVYIGLAYSVQSGIKENTVLYLDELPFLIAFYWIYELLTGLTGFHLSSRVLARVIRFLIRIANFGGFLLTLLFYEVFNFSSGGQVLYDGWFQEIILVELIIFVKENVPGLCGIDLPKPYSRFIDLNNLLLSASIFVILFIPAQETLFIPSVALFLIIATILVSTKTEFKSSLYKYSILINLPIFILIMYGSEWGSRRPYDFTTLYYYCLIVVLTASFIIAKLIWDDRFFYWNDFREYYSNETISSKYLKSVIDAIEDQTKPIKSIEESSLYKAWDALRT